MKAIDQDILLIFGWSAQIRLFRVHRLCLLGSSKLGFSRRLLFVRRSLPQLSGNLVPYDEFIRTRASLAGAFSRVLGLEEAGVLLHEDLVQLGIACAIRSVYFFDRLRADRSVCISGSGATSPTVPSADTLKVES